MISWKGLAAISVTSLLVGCTTAAEHRENLTGGGPIDQLEAVNYFTDLEPEGTEASGELRDLLVPVAQDRKTVSGIARSAALRAMARHPHPDFFQSLVDALEDPSFVARMRAAEGLGRYRDARAVPHLARALAEDEHPWVRMKAAQALTLIGDRSAVKPLIDALADSYPDPVRYDAYLGLEALTSLDLGRDPEAWAAWWEKEGRSLYGAPIPPPGP